MVNPKNQPRLMNRGFVIAYVVSWSRHFSSKFSTFCSEGSGNLKAGFRTRTVDPPNAKWITGWWFGTAIFGHFPISIGLMSSSQLTKSIIFQRGFSPTTNQDGSVLFMWMTCTLPFSGAPSGFVQPVHYQGHAAGTLRIGSDEARFTVLTASDHLAIFYR